MTQKEALSMLKALSNDKRLKIVELMTRQDMTISRLQDYFPVSQPTISYDMKNLAQAGIVDAKKEGKWTYYSLNKKKIRALTTYLEKSLAEDD